MRKLSTRPDPAAAQSPCPIRSPREHVTGGNHKKKEPCKNTTQIFYGVIGKLNLNLTLPRRVPHNKDIAQNRTIYLAGYLPNVCTNTA